MKKCTKCNQKKEYLNFYKKSSSKDGYNNVCIPCRIEYNNSKKENTQLYYQENKEKYQQNSKKYYQNNLEKIKQKSTEYQKNNPEKTKQSYNKWRINNTEYFKIWRKNKWENDTNYKLRIILGNRLNEVLKKNKTYKNSNIIQLLNCSLDELKQYLENQFTPEMNWDNHGMIWEIDHIEPCSKFDMNIIKDQQNCFNYKNLQPLFKTTEIAKSFGYIDQTGNRNKSNK
jgi:hypothetical protein